MDMSGVSGLVCGFTVIIINLEKMKDRKYSDTSDAFLCEILSKKCN